MLETPILTLLRRYEQSYPARFHMPGHMGRAETLSFSLDVTELPGTDQLYQGGAAVLRARELAARACGAADTLLLVGGGTVGVQVMVALGQGPLVVSRDAHRSVFSAALVQQRPLKIVYPRWDGRELMFWDPVPEVAQAVRVMPGSEAWLVRPDYYGRVGTRPDLPGTALWVDAAHGAHFSFSPALPGSPSSWARAWVESAHKTLAAPTQTAWLHLSTAVDPDRAERLLGMMQTSSPSWLLLAGLDRARALASEAPWDWLLDRCAALGEEITRETGLHFLGNDWARSLGYGDKDPTRLVVDVRQAGMSGFEAADRLRQWGVQPEMADFYRVIFIATPWNTQEDFIRLSEGLKSLWKERRPRPFALPLPAPPEAASACTPWEAMVRPAQWVPLDRAAGRIAADMVGAYPPGWPAWLPGERIDAAMTAWLLQIAHGGGTLFGVHQERVSVIIE